VTVDAFDGVLMHSTNWLQFVTLCEPLVHRLGQCELLPTDLSGLFCATPSSQKVWCGWLFRFVCAARNMSGWLWSSSEQQNAKKEEQQRQQEVKERAAVDELKALLQSPEGERAAEQLVQGAKCLFTVSLNAMKQPRTELGKVTLHFQKHMAEYSAPAASLLQAVSMGRAWLPHHAGCLLLLVWACRR